MPGPLLAFDAGGVVAVVFLVISFVSWIMNTINASNKKQKDQQRRAQRRQQQRGRAQAQGGRGGQRPAGGGAQDRVKSEIEAFLEEVTGEKRQQKPRPPRPAAGQAQQRPSRQQRPMPPKPRRTPPQAPQRKSQPPAEPIFDEVDPIGNESELGAGLREHVSDYMADHIEEHVQHDVGQAVEAHMGREAIADDPIVGASRKVNKAAENIRAMLRDPDGVRNAVLINEVLRRRTPGV